MFPTVCRVQSRKYYVLLNKEKNHLDENANRKTKQSQPTLYVPEIIQRKENRI